MFIEMLEYLGLIVVIVAFYSSYQRFKNGEFTKEYQEQEEQKEPKTKFQKWWKQSYLREVYVVRAGQRKLISFIPWIGFWIAILVFIFSSFWVIQSKLHPEEQFVNLKKYEGVVLKYVVNKKTDDILVLKLKNGTVKQFHGGVVIKPKNVINKKVIIYTKQEWGVVDLGEFERVSWLEIVGQEHDMTYKYDKTYKDRYDRVTNGNNMATSVILVALKWLIFFLILLWFINRNPIKTKNQKTDKKD